MVTIAKEKIVSVAIVVRYRLNQKIVYSLGDLCFRRRSTTFLSQMSLRILSRVFVKMFLFGRECPDNLKVKILISKVH